MGFFLKINEEQLKGPGQSVSGATQMSDHAVRLGFAFTELESRGYFSNNNLDQTSAGQTQLPLLTWPFLDFIASGDRGFSRLIDLGSGNSTKWFSSYFKKVISFETNPSWYEQLRKNIPTNCELNLIEMEALLRMEFNFDEADCLLIDFAGKRTLFIKNLRNKKLLH
jgi:hypothetical protein